MKNVFRSIVRLYRRYILRVKSVVTDFPSERQQQGLCRHPAMTLIATGTDPRYGLCLHCQRKIYGNESPELLEKLGWGTYVPGLSKAEPFDPLSISQRLNLNRSYVAAKNRHDEFLTRVGKTKS